MNETRYQRSLGSCLRSSRGVTVVEIIIVIAIIGVLSSIAIPSFMQMRQNSEIRRVARGVTSILRQARSQAIAKNRLNTVDINSTTRQYQLTDGPDVVFQETLPTGVNFNVTTSVVFRTNGTCNTGANIVIGILDSSGATKYQVTVTPTGRIQLSR